MSVIKESAKLLKAVVLDNSAAICKKAAGATGIAGLPSIPFDMVGDMQTKEIMKYVHEYSLDDPRKMIDFLIKLHFAVIDSINENIGDIRGDILDNTLSRIENVKDLLKFAENNPSLRSSKYQDCINELSAAKNELEKKINSYIKGIKEIDSRSGFSFFLRSKVDLKKVDNNVALASAALEAYIQIPYLMAFIGVNSGSDISSYVSGAESYIQQLQDNKCISLMAAYDVKGDKTSWNSAELKAKLASVKNQQEALFDLKEEYEEDLENDVSFN